MIFDDPEFDGIPVGVIREAMIAEGLSVYPTWGLVHRFNLFNLPERAYRVCECSVTESLSPRILWMLHAFLGAAPADLEKIGDAIEKVTTDVAALKKYATASAEARASVHSLVSGSKGVRR
jgi:hypothetical protein